MDSESYREEDHRQSVSGVNKGKNLNDAGKRLLWASGISLDKPIRKEKEAGFKKKDTINTKDKIALSTQNMVKPINAPVSNKIASDVQKSVKMPGVIEIVDQANRVKMNEDVKILESFRDLSSKSLSKALEKDYAHPTIIQKYCIPSISEGRNLLCRAPTGMGKTMCFLIPIIERLERCNKPQACIISPTRELCEQIRVEASRLVENTNIRVVSIYGKKYDLPSYYGVDIVVATPGRLIDLLQRKKIDFSGIRTLVFDEADKLLDMGFEVSTREIHGYVPQGVQICLFSATYSAKLTRMINYFLPGDKVSIEMVSETLRNIKQEIVEVGNKDERLVKILSSSDINFEKTSWRTDARPDKVLVFVERKASCAELEKYLKRRGFECVSLHGDKEQVERNAALQGFRDGRYPILIATSIAARGIDVKDIKLVINYDIPKDIKEYIHRIGRTGREGKAGKSISFYDRSVSNEFRNALIEILKESGNEIPRFLEGASRSEDFDAMINRLKVSADKEVSEDETIGLWG
ncbi:dead box helicase [Ordospora colligata]|nr:dead box helicase [Ordospora colligata]